MVLFLALAGALSLSGCGGIKDSSKSKSSRVDIAFPSAQSLRGLNSKGVSAMATSYDFSRVCFAVSVTGGGIANSTPSNLCDVPVGVFQGFVAPSGSVTLDVPLGQARKLEVLAFLRAKPTDPCPSMKDLNGFSPSRLARVGKADAFDAVSGDLTVEVQLVAPEANLAVQNSMPASCQANPLMPVLASAAIASGRQVQTGGNFKVFGAVSGVKNAQELKGGAFRLQLSRQAQ